MGIRMGTKRGTMTGTMTGMMMVYITGMIEVITKGIMSIRIRKNEKKLIIIDQALMIIVMIIWTINIDFVEIYKKF